jgi:hypothetical protein
MNMPTYISYVVSAMASVGLLLFVTHIAEYLLLHTEPWGSFERANAERKTTMELRMLWCLSSAAKLKYKVLRSLRRLITTDRYGERRTMVGKIGLRHVGASACLIIWHPGPPNNFSSLETDVL